jgi:hypothetical protein
MRLRNLKSRSTLKNFVFFFFFKKKNYLFGKKKKLKAFKGPKSLKMAKVQFLHKLRSKAFAQKKLFDLEAIFVKHNLKHTFSYNN